MLEIDPSCREEFLRHFPVSHETAEKLDHYVGLLCEWNAKFNLIADSTIPQIWRRHFLDSAQIYNHIPENAITLADLGSGAGFPGIILCILGFPKTYLIESTGKKANFLRTVVNDLKLDAVVRQLRIESLHDVKFDVISARALKPLPELLKYAKPLMKKDSLCLFLKGQQADAELTEAHKYWKFDLETFSSLSDISGRVLKIRNLKPAQGK